VHVASWRSAYRDVVPHSFLAALDVKDRAEKWAQRLSSTKHCTRVALDGPQIVGFCTLQSSQDVDAVQAIGEIPVIYVHPSHWRMSVGNRLIQATLAEAEGRNFTTVTLWTFAANTSAHEFYRAMGFHLDGATKVFTSVPGVPLDVVRFRIGLRAGKLSRDD